MNLEEYVCALVNGLLKMSKKNKKIQQLANDNYDNPSNLTIEILEEIANNDNNAFRVLKALGRINYTNNMMTEIIKNVGMIS